MSEVSSQYTQQSVVDTVPSLCSSTERSTEFTIDSFPGKSGLKFCTNWLDQCLSEMSNTIPDFGNLNDAQKGKLLLQRFLLSDMKLSCGGDGVGVLPKNVNTLHLVDLPGPYVLQINKIYNLSSDPEDMFQEVPSGIKRTLMLSMTDGFQCVYGVEHRPIKDLRVLTPAGLKVVIRNVEVRSGHLLLVPEGLEVLGGMVEDLEAERKKLVKEANTPKRKRTWVDDWKSIDVDWSALAESSTETSEQVSGISNRASNLEHNSISRTPSVTNTFIRSGEEIEIPNNATSSVAADFNETNIVDATLAVSKISITEEEFAGPITLSKLKEALQGLKEAEEGSAVRKKQKPELADTQLDGTQTEMAVVTNVLNAFPAGTTCETLSKQLQQIWDEVGESDDERNKILLQINQECLDIYKRKIDQAAKSRAHLTQVSENAFWTDTSRETLLRLLEQIWHEVERHEILHQICLDVYMRKVDQAAKSRSFLCRALSDAQIELSRLGSALGEKTVFDMTAGTIKKQLAAIGLQLEHLSVLKEKREEEFAHVKSQIQKINGEIAGNSKLTEHAEAPTVNEDDLSLNKLDEFRSELKNLQKNSDRLRFLKVRNLVDAVYDLCSVLGMDFPSFINEVHPNLTDSLEVRSKSINTGTLPKLANAVELLKKEKIERLEKHQDLARQLIDLWSLMGTSPKERYSFDDVIKNISAMVDEVTLPGALSLSLIEHAELEVERLKLKASKIKVERKISHAHTRNNPEATRGKTMALINMDIIMHIRWWFLMEERKTSMKESSTITGPQELIRN